MPGHTFHPSLLRAYDARGIVGETLHEADAYHLGRAFATRVGREGGKRIAVSYDGRHSSLGLATALSRGLQEGGMQVLNLGLGPTPQLYFSVHSYDLDGGIMVTGSHNPPSHNGFKLMLGKASFFGEDLAQLGEMAAAGAYETWGAGSEEALDAQTAYVDALVEGFRGNEDYVRNAVWDAGNGAAGEVMTRLTARLPGKHTLLYPEINGDFPNHHPDPSVEKNLIDLKAAVAAQGADLGLAFDGDGDRCGLVDDTGEVLWADQFLILLAQEVLADEPGAPIIADVKCSQTLFDAIEDLGGQAIMWKTGHAHVKTKMRSLMSPLAGELSGHVFFKHRWFGFDDGLYTAVRLLSVASQRGASLSEFRKNLPPVFSTPERDFYLEEEAKFAVVEQLAKQLAADGKTVNTIDGVRVREPEGWWLVRASNTQAKLVTRVEATNQAALDSMVEEMERRLKAAGLSA